MNEEKFENMTPWERDSALLGLIGKLSQVTEIQGDAIGELQDRVKTLELSSAV